MTQSVGSFQRDRQTKSEIEKMKKRNIVEREIESKDTKKNVRNEELNRD
jgi:hypothetical protein